MQITAIKIKRYRSIYESIKCDIYPYTVIVGPNNTGKSNILRAIELALNPKQVNKRRITPLGMRRGLVDDIIYYNPEVDYPVGRRRQSKTTIELEIKLSEKEIGLAPACINGLSKIRFIREFDIKNGSSSIKVVEPSKQNQSEIDEIEEYLVRISRFLLIPSNRIFPSAYGVLDALARSIFANLKQSKTAIRALAKLRDRAQQEVSQAEKVLSDKLKNFLPDLINVSFQLSEPDLIRALQIESVKLNDGFETDLNVKGDGVQSVFIIGLLNYLASKKTDSPLILGIEEPEAHLHPEAQSYLSEILHSISKQHQVILTTHSPVMIDRAVHKHNVVVTKNIKENRVEITNANDIKLVREALGVSRGHNLLDSTVVAVVEGKTEEVLIPKIAKRFFPKLYKSIENGVVRVIEPGGAPEVKSLLKYLHRNLQPTVCLFDCDSTGKNAYKVIKDSQLANDADLFILKNRSGCHETEFEDIFPIDWTLQMLRSKFSIDLAREKWNEVSQQHNPKNPKWTIVLNKILSVHGKVVDVGLIGQSKSAWCEVVGKHIDKLESIDPVIKTYLQRIEDLLVLEIKA